MLADLAPHGGEGDITRMLLESVVRLTRMLERTMGGATRGAMPEPEKGAAPRGKPRKALRRTKKPEFCELRGSILSDSRVMRRSHGDFV